MKPVSREGKGGAGGAPGFIEIGKSVAINRMRIRVVLGLLAVEHTEGGNWFSGKGIRSNCTIRIDSARPLISCALFAASKRGRESFREPGSKPDHDFVKLGESIQAVEYVISGLLPRTVGVASCCSPVELRGCPRTRAASRTNC